VGTAVANRNRAEVEGLIGLFVNTVVLRTNLGGGPTLREVLRRVRETALGAYAHQDFPFEKLVEALKPDRQAAYSPFFQVMFDYHQTSLSPLSLPGVTHSFIHIDNNTAKFDLMLNIIDTGRTLTAYLEYSTDLYDRATIVKMLKRYHSLLEGIVDDPDQTISTLFSSIGIDRDEWLSKSLLASGQETVVAHDPRDDVMRRRAELATRRAKLPASKRSLLDGMLQSK
jgi:non-ribosomal peptide synthetase component F